MKICEFLSDLMDQHSVSQDHVQDFTPDNCPLRAGECVKQRRRQETHLYSGGGGRLNHSGLSGGGQADGLRSLQTTGRENR